MRVSVAVRIVELRRLDHLRHAGEPRVGHDAPEGRLAERPLGDQLVPVAARRERRLRVVEVHHAQPVEPEHVLEPGDHAVVVGHEVVAGRVHVAAVEADADARTVRGIHARR